MMRQGFFSLAVMAIIAMLALMVLNELDHVRDAPATASDATPDIILTKADLRAFDVDGKLQYRLSADSIEHRERVGLSLLERPIVEPHNDDQIWRIRADRGEIHIENRMLELSGDVEARLEGDEYLQLSTALLRYHVRSQQLSIPVDVHILHRGGETRAGHLEASLEDGVLIMRNGVETTYVPDAG